MSHERNAKSIGAETTEPRRSDLAASRVINVAAEKIAEAILPLTKN